MRFAVILGFLALVLVTGLNHVRAELFATANGTIKASGKTQAIYGLSNGKDAVAGISVQLVFINGARCSPILEVPDPNITAQRMDLRYPESVLLVRWDNATMNGCTSFAELAQAAQAYSNSLSIISYPTSRSLVVLMSTTDAPLSGLNPLGGPNPLSPIFIASKAPFLGSRIGETEGMTVTLMTTTDFDPVASVLDQDTSTLLTLIPDDGPWNRVLRAVPYVAFRLLLFICLVIVLILCFFRLVRLLLARKWAWSLRNAIFLTALVATIFFTPTMLMVETTQSWQILTSISSFLGNGALHVMLLLWTCVLVDTTPRPRLILALRSLIALSTGANTVNFLLAMLSASPSRAVVTPPVTIGVFSLFIASSVILIAVFLGFSFQFLRRTNVQFISPRSKTTLMKLTRLSWIAALVTLAILLTNAIAFFSPPTSPATLLIYWLSITTIMPTRLLVLLFVLGIPTLGSSSAGSTPLPTTRVSSDPSERPSMGIHLGPKASSGSLAPGDGRSVGAMPMSYGGGSGITLSIPGAEGTHVPIYLSAGIGSTEPVGRGDARAYGSAASVPDRAPSPRWLERR